MVVLQVFGCASVPSEVHLLELPGHYDLLLPNWDPMPRVTGLHIQKDWAQKVMSRQKCIEIRNMDSNHVGHIVLVYSNTVVGSVWQTGTIQFQNTQDALAMSEWHGVSDAESIEKLKGATGRLYGYIWLHPIAFTKPLENDFPEGAQKWLVIDNPLMNRIRHAWAESGATIH